MNNGMKIGIQYKRDDCEKEIFAKISVNGPSDSGYPKL